MNLKQLIADDDAVSPVIGVILMVAITVILAAVIGTFVMDLGQNAASRQASAGVSADGYTVTLTSKGADTTGIACSKNPSDNKNATKVGESITCENGSKSVIAYSDSDGVQNTAVYTFETTKGTTTGES